MSPLRCAFMLVLAGLFLTGCGGADNPPPATKDTSTAAAAADEVPAAQDVTDIERFGAPVTLTETTTITDLNAKPKDYVTKVVRIEGTVVDVCKGMGCWVEVKAADGASIIARSMDHSVSVPKNCENRPIVVQGTFMDMGAPPETPAPEPETEYEEGGEPHKCPSPIYMLSMDAVELGKAPEEPS